MATALVWAVVLLSGFALIAELGIGSHGKRDTLARDIDFCDRHLHLLLDFYNIRWILDKLIRELTDVHETILMHAHIDERPKGSHIGNQVPGSFMPTFKSSTFSIPS